MHASMFAHRLLFLLLFIVSAVSWLYVWLIGYLHPAVASSTSPVLKPHALTVIGLLLTLACAALEFSGLFENDTLLLVLAGIGLVMPWGGALGGRFHTRVRTRKL